MDTVVFPRVRLRGVSGSYRDREHFLEKEVFTIGRAPGLDLILADRMVSGRHARIVHQDDGYWLEDLNSTNGTFVNGARVDRHRLRTGDRIAFDRVEFVFEDPQDVPRTVMAPVEAGHDVLQVTESRAPDEAKAEARSQRLDTREFSSEARAPVRRRLFTGLLAGLLPAFILGYAGILGASLVIGGVAEISWPWAKMSAVSYPLMYLYSPWLKMSLGLPFFLALCGFVLAPIAGGFVARKLGRGSRVGTATLFATAYSGVSLLLSLGVSGFRTGSWQGLFPAFLPSLASGVPTLLAGIAAIWLVCFVLSLLGTLFSR